MNSYITEAEAVETKLARLRWQWCGM